MFHSIVLMGSALTVGCGGVAEIDDGGAAGSSTSAAGTGGVNDGSLGGAPVISSAGVPSYGGALGGAGTPGGASGASNGAAGGGSVVPLRCAPAQWTCPAPEVNCPLYGGYQLRTASDCECDPTRPARAADCAPGSTFVCMQADRDAQGGVLIEPVPYGCLCEPTWTPQPEDCHVSCDMAYGIPTSFCHFPQPAAVVDPSVMCECGTIVGLK